MKRRKRRVWRHEEGFRQPAVERVLAGESVARVAREVDVHPRLLRAWVASARQAEGRASVPPVGGPYEKLRQENQQLKQALAEKLLEVDFFKGALQAVAARRQKQDKSGETASMPTSGK